MALGFWITCRSSHLSRFLKLVDREIEKKLCSITDSFLGPFINFQKYLEQPWATH